MSITTMKNGSAASSSSKSGSLTSPGTPTYRYPKGWGSERVSRPCMARGAVLPFSNGRGIPSKWEDAERWIFSPAAGGRSLAPQPHHRRPKSKSGPLGPVSQLSLSSSSAASPLNQCFSGVLGMEMASCGRRSSGGRGGGGRSSSDNSEPYLLRSTSVQGWVDAMVESCSSLQSSQSTNQDEKHNGNKDGTTTQSSSILTKDVATQLSPDRSAQSSPRGRHSLSLSASAQPIKELDSHVSKSEESDVQVNDRVTVTRWSKKHVARGSDRHPTKVTDRKKNRVEFEAEPSPGWEVPETSKCYPKYMREEAKIAAWENLQKAKAEAAIRKLEVRLEKKRSSSMDKILSKLKSAQRKAQEMRSAAATVQSQHLAMSTPRVGSYFFWRARQMSSLSGCFTRPAF